MFQHQSLKMKKINFQVFEESYVPKISQTFISLEGEGQNIGEPSIYVRVAGCYSAACKFCDTKFSWYNKKRFKYVNEEWWKELLDEKNFNEKISKIERLTITGGEPLHYMKSLYKIINVFKNPYFEELVDIKWLGIESNGNLLFKKENLFELIKRFKQIEDDFGVKPTLTISPKLDAKNCYMNQLTQSQIDKIYYYVYKNIKDYFPYEVNYKFIWDIEIDSNTKVLESLNILDDLKVKPKNIFLMPYTPKDPLGKNKEEWEKIKDITAKDALRFGIRYSPRIHIDRKLD
jgi:organic radical activating enzyme